MGVARRVYENRRPEIVITVNPLPERGKRLLSTETTEVYAQPSSVLANTPLPWWCPSEKAYHGPFGGRKS